MVQGKRQHGLAIGAFPDKFLHSTRSIIGYCGSLHPAEVRTLYSRHHQLKSRFPNRPISMMYHTSHPTDWLEFRLVSDGLETKAVQVLPLTAWHAANNPVFGFFTALPTELRLNVWEYLIVPRIVGIACRKYHCHRTLPRFFPFLSPGQPASHVSFL